MKGTHVPKDPNFPRTSDNTLSRRSMLRTAAGFALGAAASGLAGSARGQEQGIMPDGGTVPYRLPMGALNYVDQKQYIHNMEIHAHFPTKGGVTIGGGEPLTTLWARGKQRMIPGSGGFIDISD